MISCVGRGICPAPNNLQSQSGLDVMTGRCIGVVMIVLVVVASALPSLQTPSLHRSVAMVFGAVIIVTRVFNALGIVVLVFVAVVDIASGRGIWPWSICSHCLGC